MDNLSHPLTITICYAHEFDLWTETLMMPDGSTVREAIGQSQFLVRFPDFDFSLSGVGVFGEKCSPSQRLYDGDRVEIYRSLVFDPMESRRRRALHKEKKRKTKPRTLFSNRNRSISQR